MNTLHGEIVEILTAEEISLVRVKVDDFVFTSLVIDTPAINSWLVKGHQVSLFFKETEVIIAKTLPLAISIQNRIECVVKSIKSGKLLCELNLVFNEWQIRSIITRNACEQLNLQENDKVIALIKTNEVSLAANDRP
jgi:molybdopterin-binding protein